MLELFWRGASIIIAILFVKTDQASASFILPGVHFLVAYSFISPVIARMFQNGIYKSTSFQLLMP